MQYCLYLRNKSIACYFDVLDLMLHLYCVMIELQHLRNSLPDSVVVQRIDERLSALGNCIVCNDHVALTHPDLDKVILLAIPLPTMSWVPCFIIHSLHEMIVFTISRLLCLVIAHFSCVPFIRKVCVFMHKGYYAYKFYLCRILLLCVYRYVCAYVLIYIK